MCPAQVQRSVQQQCARRSKEKDSQLANLDAKQIHFLKQKYGNKELHSTRLFVRPQGYTQCVLVRNTECNVAEPLACGTFHFTTALFDGKTESVGSQNMSNNPS